MKIPLVIKPIGGKSNFLLILDPWPGPSATFSLRPHVSLQVLLKVSPESNEDNVLMNVLFEFYPKAKKDIID